MTLCKHLGAIHRTNEWKQWKQFLWMWWSLCIGQIVLVFCLCHCHCLCLGVFFLSLPIAALHPPSTPSSFLVVLVYPTPPWAPCPLDMLVWLSICSSGLGCVVGACVPSSTLVFLLPCFVALWGCFFWLFAPKSTHTIFLVPGLEESPKLHCCAHVSPPKLYSQSTKM